ncbi:MAG TPA: hypothetical protein VFU13_20330 [Steroidobacteraceae bacterium]|nr:hypothetical protein [Steroidobacteraceae bacterium]
MAEAHGTLLVRASPGLVQLLDADGQRISHEAMLALLDAASVPRAKIKAALGVKRRAYPHEGIEQREGFVSITLFGDEWMKPMRALVNHGRGLECYGRVDHEYGYTELYAMDGRDARYFGTINFESYDAAQASQVMTGWRDCVPAGVREQFPDLFVNDLPDPGADAGDTPTARWQPVNDEDFALEIRGVLRINGDLLTAGIYQREYLQRALALGAQLIYASGDAERPRSEFHYILTSLEHNVASKVRIANDMLDLAAFDLNAVCKGYGERHGTALALAAQSGLLPIVQRLLAMGADPLRGSDDCALDAAKSSLSFMPMPGGENEDPVGDGRNEGTVADYHAIVSLLERE